MTKSTRLDEALMTAKIVTKFIARRSVSATVVTLIHHNTPTYNKAQKAQLYVGGAVIGEMVAAKASDHVGARFDSAVRVIKMTHKKLEDAASEND